MDADRHDATTPSSNTEAGADDAPFRTPAASQWPIGPGSSAGGVPSAMSAAHPLRRRSARVGIAAAAVLIVGLGFFFASWKLGPVAEPMAILAGTVFGCWAITEVAP